MKIQKHIEDLIALLKDINKEPSPAVIGFIYSVASLHMFRIVFYDYIDPSITIKHQDFGSNKRAIKLESIIPELKRKNELFTVWKEMENKRNELCYGYPEKKDINEYVQKFNIIKEILEEFWGKKFEISSLEKLKEEHENE